MVLTLQLLFVLVCALVLLLLFGVILWGTVGNIREWIRQRREPRHLTSLGTWRLEFNDKFEEFPSAEAVFAALKTLVSKTPSGTVLVDEDVGEQGKFSTFVLGMHPRIYQMHFALEWTSPVAMLIFFDEAVSEYWASDPHPAAKVTEEPVSQVGSGQWNSEFPEEHLSTERAMAAIEEFLDSGIRPSWLNYRHVG